MYYHEGRIDVESSWPAEVAGTLHQEQAVSDTVLGDVSCRPVVCARNRGGGQEAATVKTARP